MLGPVEIVMCAGRLSTVTHYRIYPARIPFRTRVADARGETMTNRPRTPRWIARTALAGACSLSALSIVSVVANSWGQPPSPAQGSPAAKGAAPRPGNDRDGPDAVQIGDATEVLEAQLEAK